MNKKSIAWRQMVISAAMTFGALAKEYTFREDEALFPKPESGYYLYQELARLDRERVLSMRERGQTLIWGKIDLESYRSTASLPASLIEDLQDGFDLAQEAGSKVIVRGTYGHRGPGGDYRSYEDPDVELIKGHLEQLAPLFARNADRIAFFEAGFLGPWGEWHTTTVARNAEARRDLYLHLLENTPRDRMVVVRYPALKQSLFESPRPLSSEQAYDGSARSRTGHHNDCFLSSGNDVGTYNREGLTMADELAYLEQETLHTLFGGETCALHERSLPEVAVAEMELLHLSYLNSSYHPKVLERWRDLGAAESIEKRMGARFVLQSATMPEQGVTGSEIPMGLTLTNHGFAALYNPRPVVLVLRNEAGEVAQRFPIEDVDPRLWKPGVCTEIGVTVQLPEELQPGTYAWHLHLPDASPRLAKDPRFAIRFANKAIWNEATGEHVLVPKWDVRKP